MKKTYTATVAVTGVFYVEQTVEAESIEQAKDLFTSGRGRNVNDAYDWNNWIEEKYEVQGRVKLEEDNE